jgi:hypothetical protein
VAVLRSIERRIEALFEGVFGRAFRSHVQPVELARKLAEEMDDHRTTSVTRVYVPNEYTLYLSPEDRDQFSSYEESLRSELEEYLSEHAQREHYALASRPRVLIETDEDLEMGVFGIATRMSRVPQEQPVAPLAPVAPPDTVYFRPDFESEPASGLELALTRCSLVLGDRRYPLEGETLLLGRGHDCAIQLSDPNVSRRHAEIRREGDGYILFDLGSTNGTEVNGERIHRVPLADGDRILVGQTELVFRQEVA